MRKKKKLSLELQVVKAARRMSREEEIRLHGKPLPKCKVHESKVRYKRSRDKRIDSSYFFLHR